jgi:hypothetical protein
MATTGACWSLICFLAASSQSCKAPPATERREAHLTKPVGVGRWGRSTRESGPARWRWRKARGASRVWSRHRLPAQTCRRPHAEVYCGTPLHEPPSLPTPALSPRHRSQARPPYRVIVHERALTVDRTPARRSEGPQWGRRHCRPSAHTPSGTRACMRNQHPRIKRMMRVCVRGTAATGKRAGEGGANPSSAGGEARTDRWGRRRDACRAAAECDLAVPIAQPE